MDWVWAAIRWVHLVAAIAWIGGQLFLVLVLLPVLRRVLPSAQRTLLVAQLGRRFAVLSWIALALLVVTGFLNGERRGVAWESLPAAGSTYGQVLFAKLCLVAVVIALTLLHGQVLGPRMTRLAAQAAGNDPQAEAHRRRLARLSAIVSVTNLLLNLIIVYLAARLVS
ncbi:hypothetical protein HRbin26_00513 [bacterium HR26]|nr:hypothetical protein HRbin26_00513 [bacterium HR26]